MIVKRNSSKIKIYTEVEIPESRWNINVHDWILLERIDTAPTVVLGKFESSYGPKPHNRPGGIVLELPYYRIGIHEIQSVEFPVITHVNVDARRSFRNISEISVGLENIVKRLLKLHPSYEAYVGFIGALDRY